MQREAVYRVQMFCAQARRLRITGAPAIAREQTTNPQAAPDCVPRARAATAAAMAEFPRARMVHCSPAGRANAAPAPAEAKPVWLPAAALSLSHRQCAAGCERGR